MATRPARGRVTRLGEIRDPEGRAVELTQERWNHIIEPVDGHPELERFVADLLATVEAPDRRLPARRANEEWFYRRGVGPSEWLQVVVAYERGRGWIVTAFARRDFP